MGRKPKVVEKTKKETKKLTCLYSDHEGSNPLSEINFYNSNSKLAVEGKATICKKCLKKIINYDDINTIYEALRLLDLPFIYDVWIMAENAKSDTFGKYISMIATLPQYSKYNSYSDSVFESKNEITKKNLKREEEKKKELLNDEEYIEKQLLYKQNKADTIRLLGYDPFEKENEEDRPLLYAKITNMLSEEVLEDELKTGAIVSIIKGQNQENKLNDLITCLSNNSEDLLMNIGTIKSLTDTKEKLNKSILLLAKDNKISDMYSGNKTVGSNTLSGKLKKVRELNLNEAQVNLFDIRTSQGMQQVANLSAKAIIENLNFGDDDLLDMVKFQREKLDFYANEYNKLKEENRKLRVLCSSHGIDYKEQVLEADYKELLEYDDESKKNVLDKLDELNSKVEKVECLNIDEYAEKIIKDKEEKEKNKIKSMIQDE